MPAAAEHRAWAANNEQFYRDIGGPDSRSPAWAVVVLFYVAVHEIQAFLVDRRTALLEQGLFVPAGHDDRIVVLRKGWGTRLAPLYKAFLDWSVQARYMCWLPDRADIVGAEEQLADIRQRLAEAP